MRQWVLVLPGFIESAEEPLLLAPFQGQCRCPRRGWML